jgi:hypothetical protein
MYRRAAKRRQKNAAQCMPATRVGGMAPAAVGRYGMSSAVLFEHGASSATGDAPQLTSPNTGTAIHLSSTTTFTAYGPAPARARSRCGSRGWWAGQGSAWRRPAWRPVAPRPRVRSRRCLTRQLSPAVAEMGTRVAGVPASRGRGTPDVRVRYQKQFGMVAYDIVSVSGPTWNGTPARGGSSSPRFSRRVAPV